MQEITAAEVKQRLDAGEKLNIIDVREPNEYAEVNMGGKLVPLGKILSFQADELEDLKEEEVIMQCRSGKRSMQAGMTLETMGFTNVKNLTGGIMAWLDLNK
jgi:rhodanese-related sulfurtransferase